MVRVGIITTTALTMMLTIAPTMQGLITLHPPITLAKWEHMGLLTTQPRCITALVCLTKLFRTIIKLLQATTLPPVIMLPPLIMPVLVILTLPAFIYHHNLATMLSSLLSTHTRQLMTALWLV